MGDALVAASDASRQRASVSARWSGTTMTCIIREYFMRAAQKTSLSLRPSAYLTLASPKSNCVYSPGRPSNRTIASFRGAGRSSFTSAAIVLRLPVNPQPRARRSTSVAAIVSSPSSVRIRSISASLATAGRPGRFAPFRVFSATSSRVGSGSASTRSTVRRETPHFAAIAVWSVPPSAMWWTFKRVMTSNT